MSIMEYIKEKIPFFIINTLLFILLAILMRLSHTKLEIIGIAFIAWFTPIFVYMVMDLIKKKIYFDELKSNIEQLDRKYLLSEIISKPEFVEGKVIYEIIKESNRSMNEEVKKYREMQLEYREYIEAWVHEIKTPIASAELITENNINPEMKKINYELKKVEGFIEQVLYYARSNEASKDYIVKQFSLKLVITNLVKKNSRDFITKRIAIDIGEIDYTAYSDIKWVEFILNQLIVNAIKYAKNEDGSVSISAISNENNVVLSIQDNGVGIIEKDINRVFDKGFTGENGRIYGKSTGMGLYLCKNLCDKLGLGIRLTSKIGEGTKVDVIFPHTKFMNFGE